MSFPPRCPCSTRYAHVRSSASRCNRSWPMRGSKALTTAIGRFDPAYPRRPLCRQKKPRGQPPERDSPPRTCHLGWPTWPATLAEHAACRGSPRYGMLEKRAATSCRVSSVNTWLSGRTSSSKTIRSAIRWFRTYVTGWTCTISFSTRTRGHLVIVHTTLTGSRGQCLPTVSRCHSPSSWTWRCSRLSTGGVWLSGPT